MSVVARCLEVSLDLSGAVGGDQMWLSSVIMRFLCMYYATEMSVPHICWVFRKVLKFKTICFDFINCHHLFSLVAVETITVLLFGHLRFFHLLETVRCRHIGQVIDFFKAECGGRYKKYLSYLIWSISGGLVQLATMHRWSASLMARVNTLEARN